MKELSSYIINYETLLIIPYIEDEKKKVIKSKIFEVDDEFIVAKNPFDIISDSCLFFGSSFDGRREGTKNLINCEIKVPIIIEDSKNLIFFPTSSYRSNRNIWVSYKNLITYKKYDLDSTLFKFIGNNDIKINVKYNIVDNQIIRCIKLNDVINKRKMIKSE